MWAVAGFSRGARCLFRWCWARFTGQGFWSARSSWYMMGSWIALKALFLFIYLFWVTVWGWLIELDPRNAIFCIQLLFSRLVEGLLYNDIFTLVMTVQTSDHLCNVFTSCTHLNNFFSPLPGRCGEDWLHPAAPVLSSIWMETDVCAANTHCQNKQVPKPSEILSRDNTRFV